MLTQGSAELPRQNSAPAGAQRRHQVIIVKACFKNCGQNNLIDVFSFIIPFYPLIGLMKSIIPFAGLIFFAAIFELIRKLLPILHCMFLGDIRLAAHQL